MLYNALRLKIITWLTLFVFVIAAVLFGLLRPAEVGTLNFTIFHEGAFRDYYVDYDNGIAARQSLTHVSLRIDHNAYLWDANDNTQLALSPQVQQMISNAYDGLTLHETSLAWLVQGETMLAVGSRSNPAETILFLIDVYTGEWINFASYEGMNAGFFSLSPDAQYLLLREDQMLRTIMNPRPMLLVDLQNGRAIDLGSPHFAYWSPDSSKLAIGYASEIRYTNQLHIYDILSDSVQDFDVLITQMGTPFFAHQELELSKPLLWNPNSDSLVAINHTQEILHHVRLNGPVQDWSIGQISPHSWSPDGQFLLGIGRDNQNYAGAFIIEPATAEYWFVQSPELLLETTTDVIWSPDGRYLAVAPRRKQDNMYSFAIYNRFGEMVGTPFHVTAAEDTFIPINALRWY